MSNVWHFVDKMLRKHRHTSNTAWETVSLAEKNQSSNDLGWQSVQLPKCKNVILPFCQGFVLRLSNDNGTPAAVWAVQVLVGAHLQPQMLLNSWLGTKSMFQVWNMDLCFKLNIIWILLMQMRWDGSESLHAFHTQKLSGSVTLESISPFTTFFKSNYVFLWLWNKNREEFLNHVLTPVIKIKTNERSLMSFFCTDSILGYFNIYTQVLINYLISSPAFHTII